MKAAQAAFPVWTRTSPAKKRDILVEAASIFERRQFELGDYPMAETGASQYFSHGFNNKTAEEILTDIARRVSSIPGQVSVARRFEYKRFRSQGAIWSHFVNNPLVSAGTMPSKPTTLRPWSQSLCLRHRCWKYTHPKKIRACPSSRTGNRFCFLRSWASARCFSGSLRVQEAILVQSQLHLLVDHPGVQKIKLYRYHSSWENHSNYGSEKPEANSDGAWRQSKCICSG